MLKQWIDDMELNDIKDYIQSNVTLHFARYDKNGA